MFATSELLLGIKKVLEFVEWDYLAHSPLSLAAFRQIKYNFTLLHPSQTIIGLLLSGTVHVQGCVIGKMSGRA